MALCPYNNNPAEYYVILSDSEAALIMLLVRHMCNPRWGISILMQERCLTSYSMTGFRFLVAVCKRADMESAPANWHSV